MPPSVAIMALGLCVAASPAAVRAQPVERPSRIVSLDLCADQLLVELVDRKRIAAVTHLAADPAVSSIPEMARGIPITRGTAEDVLRYDPDLILAGPYGVSETVDLLKRLKRNVTIVPLPSDLDGVRVAMRTVAAAVGERHKGEMMVSTFDKRVRIQLVTSEEKRPSAIVYQVGGTVSGSGSLAEAALIAAGFRNKAAEYRLTRNGQVPLELLVAAPPDLLVLSSNAEEYRTAISDNLRNPVLARFKQEHAWVELPWQLWLCGTPRLADAIERLVQAREKLRARTQ